jgi:hypothetical protein
MPLRIFDQSTGFIHGMIITLAINLLISYRAVVV